MVPFDFRNPVIEKGDSKTGKDVFFLGIKRLSDRIVEFEFLPLDYIAYKRNIKILSLSLCKLL